MFILMVIAVNILFFSLYVFNDGEFGGTVKDYKCEKCNTDRGPQTYIPAQNRVPKCYKCGNLMVETDEI